MHRVYLALPFALVMPALSAEAATVAPTIVRINVPADTQNPGPTGDNLAPSASVVLVDDVYLNRVDFPEVSFIGSQNFQGAQRFQVLSNRDQVNVEWGDADTASDGDPDPMTRIGQSAAQKESTDPAIQDAALLGVFGSLSLTEMTDGEGGIAHSYKLTFANGIKDNDPGVDLAPEIVLFERGRNDVFDLSLIIGGTFDEPLLSDPLTIDSATFADVGLRVDTTEIESSQIIGVGGFDLNDWNLDPDTTVYGFVFEGFGADLAGIFAAGQPDQVTPPLEPPVVPLPAGLALLLTALGSMALARTRRRV